MPLKIRVVVHLEQQPEVYKVHPDLGRFPSLVWLPELIINVGNVLGIKEDTRVSVVQALWNYIKLQDLQDKVDRRLIHADASLRGVCYPLASSDAWAHTSSSRYSERTPSNSNKYLNVSTASWRNLTL